MSGGAPVCMHQLTKTATEETSGGRWEEYEYKEACGKPVGTYRQCGAGCKLLRGYCEDHGGDQRAQDEMRKHHETHR